MKKLVLLIGSFILFSYGVKAQCKTCSQGKHDPNDFSYKLPPDGNGTLGQSYVLQNVCGLNYVTGGIQTTTRYPGGSGFPAPVTITAKCMTTIQKAFLYWGASYTEGSPPSVTASVTNPANQTGNYSSTLIGTGGSVCWAETGTAVYRADVTAAISGEGTYTINLSGFANENYEVDGVSLIIIYSSAATFSGSISIWDGDIVYIGGSGSETLGGFSACAASSKASAFFGGGDMQNNIHATNVSTINGSTGTFPNNFWNTNVIDPINNLTNGQSTCVFNTYTNNGGSDCWFWPFAGLYWQDTNCISCSAQSLLITNTKTDPLCANNNGTATVTPTSGNAPYTYLWSPNGATTQTVSGLSAGTYIVKVKDAGCDSVMDTVILVSNVPVASASQIGNIKCNGDMAGTDASVKGGTGPYTYSWSPSGGSKDTATNLTAGTYTVTVTDHLGCISTASVNLTQPAVLSATKTISNVLCFGGNTGSAKATVSGGTGPYTYKWSPSGGTNPTANNLTAGTYVCTITDANGCISHDTAIVKQPAVLKDTVTFIGSTCNGSNGSVSATASGGTPTYTYKWSPSGGTKSTASGLSAGTYTVTLTDANGCSKTTSITITNVGLPSVTTTRTDVNCNGGTDGSIVTNVTGGTPPYTYAWSPSGGTSATASGLSAGKYTCTITDAIGCVIEDTVTITQPVALSAAFDDNHSTCGDSNGSAVVSPMGGVAPYTYLWSDGKTTSSISGLSAGTYTVTVTDSHGCILTDNTIVKNLGSDPLVILCCDTTIAPGDSALLNTADSGGVNFSWIPPDGLSCTDCPDPVATPTVTTTYTETVSDANGCTTVKTVTVTIEIPCSDFSVPNVFTPNDDGINDDFVVKVENPSSYNILVYDRWGKEVYSSTDATKYWNGRYNNTDYLVPDGVYYYIIKASCGDNNYEKKGFVHVIGRSK